MVGGVAEINGSQQLPRPAVLVPCACVCCPGRNAPLQMFPVRRDASPGCQQTSENDRDER